MPNRPVATPWSQIASLQRLREIYLTFKYSRSRTACLLSVTQSLDDGTLPPAVRSWSSPALPRSELAVERVHTSDVEAAPACTHAYGRKSGFASCVAGGGALPDRAARAPLVHLSATVIHRARRARVAVVAFDGTPAAALHEPATLAHARRHHTVRTTNRTTHRRGRLAWPV